MTAYEFIFQLLVMVVSSVGIGAVIIQRFKIHPAASLCLAVALSWIILFQVTFLAFLAGMLPQASIVLLLVSIGCVVLGRKQITRWFLHPYSRQMIIAFFCMLTWLLLYQAVAIIYSSGYLYGDWFEHYERMLFFRLNLPHDIRFLEGMYELPARPPMQNVCQAYIASCVTNSFAGFQVSSTFLVALLALPAFLAARLFAVGPGVSVWITAGLIASSWPLVTAATFTWTKGFTGFYILLALVIYQGRNFRGREMLVFILMGSAVLVHYSAALFLVPLLLWHAWTYLQKPRLIPQAVSAGLPGALLLVPWVVYVLVTFDTGLLGATSTADMTGKYGPLDNISWKAIAYVRALVPFYYGPELEKLISLTQFGTTRLSAYRTSIFTLVQHSWMPSIGLTGMLMLLYACLHRAKVSWKPFAFWAWMLLATVFFLVMSHPTSPTWGLCHIAMLPMVVVVSAWIAGAWPGFSKGWRWAMIGLLAIQMVGPVVDGYVHSCAPRLTTGEVLPGFDPNRVADAYPIVIGNLVLKMNHKLVFLADTMPTWLLTFWYGIALLACFWVFMVWWTGLRLPALAGRIGKRK